MDPFFLISDTFLTSPSLALPSTSASHDPTSSNPSSSLPTTSDLRNYIQKGPDHLRILALKHLILSTLSGGSNTHQGLLMPVIQYVLPSKDKRLKKLLHFYWEVCPKYEDNVYLPTKKEKEQQKSKSKGKKDGLGEDDEQPQRQLRQEMILVCNAIRNDLQHPNEYIRGATLRFLQKIREPELLEPLVPTARACLEHRHSYVRKNAIFAIYAIYRNVDHLVPDAPDLLETFLVTESDPTCLRNAFVSLAQIDPKRALGWLNNGGEGVWEQIVGAGGSGGVGAGRGVDEGMQLAVVEVLRKEGGKTQGAERARYIRLILELLSSSSRAVKYEAANTITGLTANPAAVKAAATCFISLINKESDNNIKLIVLDRIDHLRERFGSDGVLDDLVVDLLGVLGSPDIEVRRKALRIGLEMVTSRNADEVVGFLKKELAKSLESPQGKQNAEYRQLLIHSVHTLSIAHPLIASSTIYTLMDFLSDPAATGGGGSAVASASTEVISFVREVVEKFPDLRKEIVARLIQGLGEMRSGKVFRGGLWIVGEYAEEVAQIRDAFQQIRKIIGEVPILASEQRLLDQQNAEKEANGESSGSGDVSSTVKPTTTTRVLPDGTYATETVYPNSSSNQAEKLAAVKAASKPPLRALILGGDFYTASVLASTLTKLVLRFGELAKDGRMVNELRAEAMLIMTSIIRAGQSQFSTVPIDEDSTERILSCLQSLSSMTPSSTADTASQSASEELSSTLAESGRQGILGSVKEIFLKDTKKAYAEMVIHEEKKAKELKEKDKKGVKVQADDLISFRQFAKKGLTGDGDEYEMDIAKATGMTEKKDDFISKLSRVVQLTGFSDPVYAEAYVKCQQFDVLLDVLIVNQTTETLQNLTVEFAVLGDLKLVERPIPYTLGPHSFQSIKTTVKVSSTETGVIFGNIFWDGSATADSHSVVLNDVHIDILDYINPAECAEGKFRSMWTEFEWENRVNVNTKIDDLRVYLKHIMNSTNMACLTPEAALEGDCGFLSANLYARSLFGEDALANLSIEKTEDSIQGHVRIRSKTQGIALALGDKITLAQKTITVA